MIPLEPCAPVGSKAVFNARTNEKPTLGVGSTGGERADTRHHGGQGCGVVHPGAAGLAIEQPVVCRPAEACCKARDPINFCTGSDDDWGDDRRRVRLDVRSIEHPFDADNKLGRDLPIIADLTASDKSRASVAEAHIEETIGECRPLPRASHIAANIKPVPIIIIVRIGTRRHIGRCGDGPSTGTSAANAPGEAVAKSAAMPNAKTPFVALVRRIGGVSAAYVSTDFTI